MDIGFSHEQYIKEQSRYILERCAGCDKLYLEFGGKLMFDTHAKRCLPGYQENAKLELLASLKDSAEIIICVNANDIARSTVRGDSGISYEMDVLRLIDDLRRYEIKVNSVLVTRYHEQPGATAFMKKLENRGIATHQHKSIAGYPDDVDAIVSEAGYGSNTYIETTAPIVVVTAPGPGSGKLATCLNQLYHEKQHNKKAMYAKFETFPVWNLPLKHPLNVAYEAATVDLKDSNMLDFFHLEAHGETAVNYNRDMEMFPVIKTIIERITGCKSVYASPTDMGVNMIASAIVDDEIVAEASRQEIIRRYFKTAGDLKHGTATQQCYLSMQYIMKGLDLSPEDRAVVVPARNYLAQTQEEMNKTDDIAVVAIELADKTIILGRNSVLMSASAAALLNAVKHLGGLPDNIHLLSPSIIRPILTLKTKVFNDRTEVLGCEDVLIALSISAVTNPVAASALEQTAKLASCQAHCTCFAPDSDLQTLRKLGMDMTCDSEFMGHSLYYH